jgi:hypothetical protein
MRLFDLNSSKIPPAMTVFKPVLVDEVPKRKWLGFCSWLYIGAQIESERANFVLAGKLGLEYPSALQWED